MTGEYTPKEVSALLGLVDTYMRYSNYKKRNDRSYEYYHPSEIGKCLRKQQYKHYAQKGYIKVEFEPFESKILRLFDKGHNMHNRWTSYFDKMGNILLGKWRCLNPLCLMADDEGKYKSIIKDSAEMIMEKNKTRIYGESGPVFRPAKCICGCKKFTYEEADVIDESLNLKGRSDMIINCDNLDVDKFKDVSITFDKRFLPINGKKMVGDFKTINDRQCTNRLMKKGAHREYLIQLTIYTHILDCDYGMLMYENKNNSEMYWYMVPRNDKWWEIIKYQLRTMIDMAEGSVHRLPPPRPSDKKDYECMNCEFKNICRKSSIWDKKNFNDIRRNFYKDLL